MGQRIRLTWTGDDGKQIVEQCNLLYEDDAIFVGGHLVEDGMAILMNDGRILFEDAEGIFGLKPKQIISIEKL